MLGVKSRWIFATQIRMNTCLQKINRNEFYRYKIKHLRSSRYKLLCEPLIRNISCNIYLDIFIYHIFYKNVENISNLYLYLLSTKISFFAERFCRNNVIFEVFKSYVFILVPFCQFILNKG